MCWYGPALWWNLLYVHAVQRDVWQAEWKLAKQECPNWGSHAIKSVVRVLLPPAVAAGSILHRVWNSGLYPYRNACYVSLVIRQPWLGSHLPPELTHFIQNSEMNEKKGCILVWCRNVTAYAQTLCPRAVINQLCSAACVFWSCTRILFANV